MHTTRYKNILTCLIVVAVFFCTTTVLATDSEPHCFDLDVEFLVTMSDNLCVFNTSRGDILYSFPDGDGECDSVLEDLRPPEDQEEACEAALQYARIVAPRARRDGGSYERKCWNCGDQEDPHVLFDGPASCRKIEENSSEKTIPSEDGQSCIAKLFYDFECPDLSDDDDGA